MFALQIKYILVSAYLEVSKFIRNVHGSLSM